MLLKDFSTFPFSKLTEYRILVILEKRDNFGNNKRKKIQFKIVFIFFLFKKPFFFLIIWGNILKKVSFPNLVSCENNNLIFGK